MTILMKRNCLDSRDEPEFSTHRDVLRCFGYSGGHYQRATWRIPDGSNRVVWFPKFYENDDWDNSISNDGLEIVMVAKTEKAKARLRASKTEELHNTMVVFAHIRGRIGRKVYRFIGLYEENSDRSDFTHVVFGRTSTSVAL